MKNGRKVSSIKIIQTKNFEILMIAGAVLVFQLLALDSQT